VDEFEKLKNVDKLKRPYAIEIKVVKVTKLIIDFNPSSSSYQEWVLEAIVKDKYSSSLLALQFDHAIVANFAKRSTQEMCLLYHKMKTQPQLRDDIKAILDQINDQIQFNTLLAVITTKMHPPTGYRVVLTNILRLTDDNKQAIMLKIHDEDISEV
jgi:hypothetical protein